eukprot:2696424-Pleurochrysis_carterae.AAC.1
MATRPQVTAICSQRFPALPLKSQRFPPQHTVLFPKLKDKRIGPVLSTGPWAQSHDLFVVVAPLGLLSCRDCRLSAGATAGLVG